MCDGVGQETPHDLIRFCDECGVVVCFVLLSLGQLLALVLVQLLEKNVRRRRIFSRTRAEEIPPTGLCPPEQADSDEQRSRSASVDVKKSFDIIESHVALLCVPRL